MMGRLARLSRPEARERAAELIERFDLTGAARRRVGTYSGGMRRRLDIAASLDDVFLTLTQPGQTRHDQTRADNAKEISHV